MILDFGVFLIVDRPVYGSWGGDNLFLNASDWTYTFESSKSRRLAMIIVRRTAADSGGVMIFSNLDDFAS